MSKNNFKLRLLGIAVILILYAVIGGFFKFYSLQESYYLFWKDLIPLILGIAIVALTFDLQCQINNLQTLFSFNKEGNTELNQEINSLNNKNNPTYSLKDVPPKTAEDESESEKSAKLPGSHGEHQVQAQFSNTRRALAFYNKQVLNYLNPLMREFLSEQTIGFIATADAQGECDCSFRAGLPGFVQVLSDKLIAYPEYRGNGVMASIGNITENPHIGLIFIDFFKTTVGLHVNGKAHIVENEAVLTRQDVTPAMIEAIKTKGGLAAERWIFIEIEEAYIHCSKHIPLLQKLDKKIHWGTDDQRYKGGDAFNAKNCPRPWVAT